VSLPLSIFTALIMLAAPCSDNRGADEVQASQPSPAATAVRTPPDHTSADHTSAGPAKRIPYFRQLSERFSCGAEPVTIGHFQQLKQAGVRHIISVDGKQPDVKTASEMGIGYVHIPFGYDAIPAKARLSLVRAVRELEGPIFIHCHHGKHRGPAAAAIACREAGAVTKSQAITILREAGTSEDYIGLWQAVRSFQSPKPDVKLPALRSRSAVPPMAKSMAAIARHLDRFERGIGNERQQAAVLIYEGLRESHRLQSAQRTKEFRQWMAESRDLAQTLYKDTQKNADSVPEHLAALRESCVRCHAAYRN